MMKNFFVLWLLLLFLISKTFAQNNSPSVLEINSDTVSTVDLDSNQWQKLEDSTGKLSFIQVSQQPIANNFHPNTSGKRNFSTYAYWFRYRIKNSMNHRIKITIPTDAGYCDLYVSNGTSKWQHYRNGWLVPWSQRDGLKYLTQIVLALNPAEELLIYQRVRIMQLNTLNPEQIAPLGFNFFNDVIRQAYFNNENPIQNPLEYVLIGIALLAALFNLFFYRIVHEKIYLSFSLFLIFFAIESFFGKYAPLAAETSGAFLREYPFLVNAVYFISYDLMFFYFFYFIRDYFGISNNYPKWNKFLIVIGVYYLIIPITPLLIPFLSDGWNQILIWLQIIMRDIALFVLLFTCFLFIWTEKFASYRWLYLFPFLMQSLTAPALDTYYLFLPLFFHYPIRSATPAWIQWIGNWSALIDLVCLSWLVLFFSLDLFQRFRMMQKKIIQQTLERENERSQLIEQQKVELEKTVEERTAELKYSLQELKSTQSQLIQSEKMASLGELTAGIAHEIQNPLNFVNNFSEVNKELVAELQAERSKANGERNEELENEILIDIKDNSEKIIHHGKRADAIVKNMLQHSKQTKGVKEPTDINALCDEYLRLSYHGLRAKDKTFNAELKTDFDPTIGKINIIPQDIGRVLLNLFNNAFYAVNEQKNRNLNLYNPTVSVTTRKSENHVIITVSDNGRGIPQKIVDKIFQPFFTTRPTGEGTGLGLSLSYDIVKAHGGEIIVESKGGEGSEFSIQLPLTKPS